MNLRELKGTAVGSCTFCSTVAACDVFVRSDGAELLVCGEDHCRQRLARHNGTVHNDRARSLTEARRAQGRNPLKSTEL
jgi:ribosome-binding protein aMBF1 (putative translation factor)